MSADDVHTSVSSPSVPRPRSGTAADDEPATRLPRPEPWPEPWRPTRGARPRTQYWDVATAGWCSSDPLAPRPTD